MAEPNISLLGATYSGVKGVTLPKSGGGTATFPWVEGSETKTANGTYDVTNLAQLVVDVSGGGGASNYVHGEFTTQSKSGVQSVTIPYTGTGYPIMCYVVIKGGAYVSGTTWYNSLTKGCVGVWAMSKSDFSTTPTYNSSDSKNNCVVCAIYKNSTSNATTYTRTSSMTSKALNNTDAGSTAAACVHFKSAKSLSVYINLSTASYGLLSNQNYEYFIVYSS